jgi:hypothetical protein
MIYYSIGSPTTELSDQDLKNGLFEALTKMGAKNKVLALPPDYTRLPSRAGQNLLHLPGNFMAKNLPIFYRLWVLIHP